MVTRRACLNVLLQLRETYEKVFSVCKLEPGYYICGVNGEQNLIYVGVQEIPCRGGLAWL
jgi:hypothetical protein